MWGVWGPEAPKIFFEFSVTSRWRFMFEITLKSVKIYVFCPIFEQLSWIITKNMDPLTKSFFFTSQKFFFHWKKSTLPKKKVPLFLPLLYARRVLGTHQQACWASKPTPWLKEQLLSPVATWTKNIALRAGWGTKMQNPLKSVQKQVF